MTALPPAHLQVNFDNLIACTAAAKQATRTLLDELDARQALERLDFFDHENGVLMLWTGKNVYCDITPEGTFTVAHWAPGLNAVGFVDIVNEDYESAKDVAKCMRLILLLPSRGAVTPGAASPR